MVFLRDRNIIFELTRKQVRTQYRDSTLGFIWTFLNPLLNMLVMWMVFKTVLGITDPYYPLYILCGNVLFAAVRASTQQALRSMVDNRGLLLRTKIDLSVFPFSNILTSIVNFAFSLIALIPFMIWLTFKEGINLFTYRLVFILPMVPALMMFEYGLGLFLSATYVFFRDLKHLYDVFLTLWHYTTPIFYTLNRVEKNSVGMTLIKINPLFHFVNYFRDACYRGVTGKDIFGTHIGAYIPQWTTLGYLYAFGAISLIVGEITYNALKSRIITKI